MLSFILHGFILRDRLHSKSIVVCTIVSSTMFLIAAKLTPSFYLFQLLPIIIGLLLTYSLFKINEIKKKKTFQKWYDTIMELKNGKYAELQNRKEIALSKGLSQKDLVLIGYRYTSGDMFANLIGKLSPWSDGEYVEDKDSSN